MQNLDRSPHTRGPVGSGVDWCRGGPENASAPVKPGRRDPSEEADGAQQQSTSAVVNQGGGPQRNLRGPQVGKEPIRV